MTETAIATTSAGFDDARMTELKRAGAVDITTKLLPVEVCQAAVREYSDFGKVGHEVAAKQARVLLGSYPREPHDPATFTAAIVQVLAEQAPGIGKMAIDRLTRRLKHYPTRADLCEAIDEILAERRAIVSRAKAHMAERLRREMEAAEAVRIAADKAALREQLGQAWDAYWSIPVLRRFADPRGPEGFRKGWETAKDKAAFCEAWGAE